MIQNTGTIRVFHRINKSIKITIPTMMDKEFFCQYEYQKS